MFYVVNAYADHGRSNATKHTQPAEGVYALVESALVTNQRQRHFANGETCSAPILDLSCSQTLA